MIKKLSIEQYKGFFENEDVEFAIPDNTNCGSGLTLIVGPNNTGKTTIIESLLLGVDKKFKESERHSGSNPKVIIENNIGNKTEFTNISDGAIIAKIGNDHEIKFELVPSRRTWAPLFNGESDFNSFVIQSSRTNIRNSDPFNLGPILEKILRDASLKKKFDEILKNLMPHFTGWTVDTNDGGQNYIKYITTNTYHQSNLLGDGVISLFRIVAHLVHSETSTFIIDEPELSLHPGAQKRLAKLISDLSKDKQIIVCTHSPYFVNWSDFINGAKIIRLNKHNDEKCTVNPLNNTKNYASFIATNIDEYQKPQLLDTSAKEILFSDRILFVEGQEDVGLIKKYAKDNDLVFNFDIFGYGVGGEINMKLFLEIAKDLNIEKVGALYDKNSISYSEDKNNYTLYKLIQHSFDDIRDKKNKEGNILKTGIFKSDGSIKEVSKEGFDKIINEFIEYFEKI